MFDLDITGILLGLHEDQQAAARSAALRNEPRPPKPPPAPVGLGGGATGGWDSPPPQPTPQAIPQQRMPQPQAQPPRQGTMLPQSMATQPQGPSAPPAGVNPVDAYDQSNLDLMARQQELTGQLQQALQPPDISGAQAAYGKRADAGGRQLMLALAAQHAGEGYQPLQGHFLKQAAAASEPMKVHGGTMTETGFIEDPGYAQELRLKQIQAQIGQNDRLLQFNLTRQDRKDAEKRAADLQRELTEYRRGTAFGAAAITAGAAGASGPGKADFEGIDATTGTEVIRGKDGRAYRATGQVGADGQAVYEPLPGTAGGNIIPKASYEKNVKEATDLAQSAAGAKDLLAKIQAQPTAFGLGATVTDVVPGVLGKATAQRVLAKMTPEAITLRTNFVRDAAMEMSKLYGAAQSAGEAHRAAGFLINPDKDSVDEVIAKLKGAQAYAEDARKRWGKAVGQGVTQRTGIAPQASAPDALPGKPRIAVNPTTGQKLQLVNGKWEPVP